MRPAKPNRILWLLPVAVLSVALCGCSRQTRHDVLTIFFTGVPPLERPKGQKKAAATAGGKKHPARAAARAGRKRPRKVMYAHPLYAAGRCDACHTTSASLGFKASGSRGSARIFGGTSAVSPARLRLPVKKLCISCHVDKSVASAAARGLWLHTPAARGKCLACHAAHESRNPHLLREKPDALCAACHLKDVVMNAVSHDQVKGMSNDCLHCHNPHTGRDRRMLTKDYREVRQAVGAVRIRTRPAAAPAVW